MTDPAHRSLAEWRTELAEGRISALALTEAYLDRIARLDPGLGAVRETNPDARAIAGRLDGLKPKKRGPLHGLPILVKDNIATDDHQATTAGSLALEGTRARHDATVTRLLREAGAVVLGKANLTEWANMLAIGMPSGYSSLGGQVRNPYAPGLDERGVPIVPPGGSSSGSAAAVAAGFAAAAIGTETSGSLLSPASQNGLVTVKPTVGLISRTGIIPIAHSQDTAGPMTRTVADAAILLDVLARPDRHDEATAKQRRPDSYVASLSQGGLNGVRIGVPSDPGDPANDVYYGPLSPAARQVMERAIEALADLGASVVRANMPAAGWIGGPGTELAVLNLNPESPTRHTTARIPIVFVYELKHDLDQYLAHWVRGGAIRSLDDVIAFNAAHAGRALRFGQDLFLAAAATRGDLSEIEYRAARRNDLLAAKKRGLDAYLRAHRLDAVLFPGPAGAAIAARAGYPSVQVPAGMVSGVAGRETPEYPLGATFTGRAWSEARLLAIAHAFEQATRARLVPPGFR